MTDEEYSEILAEIEISPSGDIIYKKMNGKEGVP